MSLSFLQKKKQKKNFFFKFKVSILFNQTYIIIIPYDIIAQLYIMWWWKLVWCALLLLLRFLHHHHRRICLIYTFRLSIWLIDMEEKKCFFIFSAFFLIHFFRSFIRLIVFMNKKYDLVCLLSQRYMCVSPN